MYLSVSTALHDSCHSVCWDRESPCGEQGTHIAVELRISRGRFERIVGLPYTFTTPYLHCSRITGPQELCSKITGLGEWIANAIASGVVPHRH